MNSLEQIDLIEELILDGTRIPFSSGRLVDEREALQVLDQLRESIPKDLNLANDMINNNNKYIDKAKVDARRIIEEANKTKQSLINKDGIKQEAQRQIHEMVLSTKRRCENMIEKAKIKADLIDKEYEERNSSLEKKYKIRVNNLNYKYDEKQKSREDSLIAEHNRLNKKLINEYNERNQQILQLKHQKDLLIKELQSLVQKLELQKEEQLEETKKYCNQLIIKSKAESEKITRGSLEYAESVLNSLDNKIITILKELKSGKNYIEKNKYNTSKQEQK